MHLIASGLHLKPSGMGSDMADHRIPDFVDFVVLKTLKKLNFVDTPGRDKREALK